MPSSANDPLQTDEKDRSGRLTKVGVTTRSGGGTHDPPEPLEPRALALGPPVVPPSEEDDDAVDNFDVVIDVDDDDEINLGGVQAFCPPPL